MPELSGPMIRLRRALRRLKQTMLLPRIGHFAQHDAKLGAERVLALQALQVRHDFERHQGLVFATRAVRVGAHQAERASQHGFKARNVVFRNLR